MKEIFDFYGKKKRLLSFTERLFEQVSSGIPLQRAVYLLGRMNFRDIRMNRLASFLYKSMLDGTKFSVAIKIAPYISVSDWYPAFISVAEECGGICAVLEHLKNLLVCEKKSEQKVFEALLYPCAVLFLTALAGFVSVFFFLPAFSEVFPGDIEDIQHEAVRTMILSDFFLVWVFVFFVAVTRKILSQSPCAGIFKTMAFLRGNAVPTMQSLSCALAFSAGEKKISEALLSVKESLLDGEKMSDCFGRCFENAGFKAEGILLSENLMLSQETGKDDGFEKTYAFLCVRQSRNEKIFFSLLQPFLLLVSAIYLGLILKTAFLPYITNFGGVI